MGLKRKQGTSKVVTARDAADKIKDGATVATGGFVGTGFPEELAIAVEERFLNENHPLDLTLIYGAGQGDGEDRGVNHFGHEGLIKRVIGGHWGLVPKVQKLAVENKIEAYNLPQGVITHIYRDIAAHKPRTITAVGLGTFVDPRNGGGKINAKTTQDLVELIEFDGKEYLAYRNQPVDVALIRATTADTDGNLTFEKEALILESLAIATAARNSGGIVIAQVERVASKGSLHARQVIVPGILVDYIVISKPENHFQTFGTPYNPAFCSQIKVPAESIPPMEMNARKIISRRGALELIEGDIVNLGIGLPEGVSMVANEEGIIDKITLTAEPGVIGGIPAGGLDFGAAVNTSAIISQPEQFDFYHGGGLDIAFLGMAQMDQQGNLNVSKYGSKLTGAGGFIDISQNAGRVVFMGTFTAGGMEIAVNNGLLEIKMEGRVGKLVKQVEHITFSGQYALKRQQPVLYITERCVFKLGVEGIELIEIAPGIDLERDILALLPFRPLVKDLKEMERRIFLSDPMGLADSITSEE
jgi:propionate CoA-transferase